jgi:hypothetical protein
MDSIKSNLSSVGQKVSSTAKKAATATKQAAKKLASTEENISADPSETSPDLENPESDEIPKPKKGPVAKAGQLNNSEIAARERELKAREEKLTALERDLEKRSEHVAKLEAQLPNWPSKCYPLTYHDIDKDIPEQYRPIVKKFYFYWRYMAVNLIVNFIAVFVIMIQTGSMSLISVLLALLYIAAGLPGSWWLWYKPIYKTMKSKSSIQWSFFIFGYTIHWLFVFCMGISVPYFAGAGLLTLISVTVSGQVVSIIFNLVAMGMWGVNWIIGGYLTKKARDEYKASGQSVGKMKTGLIGEAVKLQMK